jgi:hypothetical protein
MEPYPFFITCLKTLIGERSDYKIVIEQAKKMELAELNDGSSSS